MCIMVGAESLWIYGIMEGGRRSHRPAEVIVENQQSGQAGMLTRMFLVMNKETNRHTGCKIGSESHGTP